MTDWERWRGYLAEWVYLAEPGFMPPAPAPHSFWIANHVTRGPVGAKTRGVLGAAVRGVLGEELPRAVIGRNRWD